MEQSKAHIPVQTTVGRVYLRRRACPSRDAYWKEWWAPRCTMRQILGSRTEERIDKDVETSVPLIQVLQ